MFFKRKEKVESNTDNLTDKNIVYGVNHKDAFAALSEQDGRFNKGCFSYFPAAEALYLRDRIMINGTLVLSYYCGPGDDIRVLRYVDEGLNFKDEILTALKKLVVEHKIFVDNKEKETTKGIKNSLNDYISDYL